MAGAREQSETVPSDWPKRAHKSLLETYLWSSRMANLLMGDGAGDGKEATVLTNGHGWAPPNAVHDEQDTRTQVATHLRERSLALESGAPPDLTGAIEAFIEGLEAHAKGAQDLFPDDRRLSLLKKCLECSRAQMGAPGSSEDYEWLGRAAVLAGTSGTALASGGLLAGVAFCVSQARSHLSQDPPSNEDLTAAAPWLVAASRLNRHLQGSSVDRQTAFAEDERKNYARLYYRLGGSLFERNRFEEAANVYRIVAEMDPTHGSARYNRALALATVSRYAEAKVEIYNLTALEGWAQDSLYAMGVIAEYQKMIPEAIAFFAGAIVTGDGHSRSWDRLQRLVQKREDKSARKSRTEPEDPSSSIWSKLDQDCESCHRKISAKMLLCPYCGAINERKDHSTDASPSPGPTPGLLELPTMVAVAERYGGALGSTGDGHRPADLEVARLEEVIRKLGGLEEVGNDPSRRMDLAVALMELDRPEEARRVLEGLVREFPSSPSLSTALLRTLYKLKEWDEVLRVTASTPETEETLRFKICALIAKGEREEARKFVGHLPMDTSEQCEEVARYCVAVGDHQIALTLTDKALTQDPSNRSVAFLKELLSGQSISSSPRSSLAKFVGISPVVDLLVQRVIAPLMAPESYLSYDITNFQVLLAGPPGCGKTTIARALADEASAVFEHFRFEQVGDMYLGETEKAIHQFFVRVRREAQTHRVVLFIDEVDGLAASRVMSEQREERRIFTSILTELSDLSEHLRKETLNLRVISATNRPFDLDPSMLRTGRLGTPIYLGPPTLPARKDALQHRLDLLPHGEPIDLDAAAAETEWYSMADLMGLITDITFDERSANLVGKPWKLTSDRLLHEIRGRTPSVVGWFRQVDALIREGRIEPSDLGKGFAEDYERFLRWNTKERRPSRPRSGPPESRMFG